MNALQLTLLILGSIILFVLLYYLARYAQVVLELISTGLRWVSNAPGPFKFVVFILTFGVIGFIINWVVAANVVCADLGRGDVGVAPYKMSYFDAVAAKMIPPRGFEDVDASQTETGGFLNSVVKFFSSSEDDPLDGTKRFGTIVTTVGDPLIEPSLRGLSIASDVRGAAVMWPDKNIADVESVPTSVGEEDVVVKQMGVYAVLMGASNDRKIEACVLAPIGTRADELYEYRDGILTQMAVVKYRFYPVTSAVSGDVVAVDAEFEYENDGQGALKQSVTSFSWSSWFSTTYEYWRLGDCPRVEYADVVCRDDAGTEVSCTRADAKTSVETKFISRKMVLPQGVGLENEAGWVISTYQISGSGEYATLQSPTDPTLTKNPRAYFILSLRDGYEPAYKPGAALTYSCDTQTYDTSVRLYGLDVFNFKTVLIISVFAIVFLIASWLKVL